MENDNKKIHELQNEIQNLKEIRKTVRHNFQGMVQLLVETISLGNRFLGGHLKRTSEMIKVFREQQKLSKDTIYLGYYAALLHDIGLVGENSAVIEKPRKDLSTNEEHIYYRHPAQGYKIVNSIYNLKRIAISIRSHHENYDGSGFPDKLVGKEIPEEARIIHIINDFDNYRFKYNLTSKESVLKLLEGKGSVYDPGLLNEFESFINFYYQEKKNYKEIHNVENLEPGMYIDEDIILSNGVLLTPRGVILDELTISKIKTFSSMMRKNQIFKVIY